VIEHLRIVSAGLPVKNCFYGYTLPACMCALCELPLVLKIRKFVCLSLIFTSYQTPRLFIICGYGNCAILEYHCSCLFSGHCCTRALLIQGTNTPWLCASSHITPGWSVVTVHKYTLTQWHKHSMVVWEWSHHTPACIIDCVMWTSHTHYVYM